MLAAQQINDAIPAGLPPGTHVAHKSGWGRRRLTRRRNRHAAPGPGRSAVRIRDVYDVGA